ncbi:MAG: hypothetical protein ACXVKA_08270 [Acidimicrobiia bacterium]
MFRKLSIPLVVALGLGVAATQTSTGAAVPVHQNAGDAVHCDDFVGHVTFTTALTDGGSTAGAARWTAVSNDCHSQSAGEYDPDFNPGGIALKRATITGTFPYPQSDCSLLTDGGPGGTFLGGQLTVHWTTRTGTPALASKTSTITYPRLGRDWSQWLGNGTFLELTVGVGADPAPSVTGGFAGEDAGATSRLATVIGQSSGTIQAACAAGGLHRADFGLGYMLLG